jgi:sugar phosphate isomerase/epimerase
MIKYGIGTWAVRNYPYPESTFVLDWAQAQGLDGVEIIDAWIDFYSMDRSQLAKLKDEYARRNLEVCAICPTHVTLSERDELAQRNSQRVEKAIEVAGFLGAPIVNTSLVQTIPPHTSFDAEERHYENIVAALGKLADRAADLGVSLSLELHEHTLVDVSSALLKVLQMLDRPNVGANPDLGNWLVAFDEPAEKWEEAIDNLKPYANYWHVKTFLRVFFKQLGAARTLEVSLPWGDIDYRLVMRRMFAEPAYDGYIAIEVERSGDPFALMEPSIPYLREIVAEVTS